MSDEEHDNFKPGEDVLFVPAGAYGERRGTVRKVTATRVTIDGHDGETTVLHRSKYGSPYRCRRVTDRDRARWQRDAEMAAWEAALPKTKQLFLSQWVRGGDYRLRMTESAIATLEALEQVADEAEAIREWLRKRPEEPRS